MNGSELDCYELYKVAPDPRMQAAIDVLSAKQDVSGCWPLGPVYPEEVVAEPGVAAGDPSRWNTLRALRVLKWFQGAA